MPDSWNYSQRPERASAQGGPPLTTFILCLICVLVTFARSFPDPALGSIWYSLGHTFEPDLYGMWSGKYYDLVLPVFAHSNLLHSSLGFMHLLFNMWWLVKLGGAIERTTGPHVLLAVCVVSAAASSAVEMLFGGVPGIGMSGVVYALLGMMWAAKGRYAAWDALATPDTLWLFVRWGIFCIVITYIPFLNTPIANFAHFGGLLFGIAMGYVFFAVRRRPVWIAVLALFAVLVVMAVTWIPWNPYWQIWHSGGAG